MMKLSAPLIVWILGLTAAHGASFDCTHPRLSSIESLICSDGGLSKHDDNLSIDYGWLLSVTVESERKDLRDDQRKWLREVRDQCTNLACLEDAYVRRYSALQDKVPARIASNNQLLQEVYRGQDKYVEDTRRLLQNCDKNDSTLRDCILVFHDVSKVLLDRALAKKHNELPACKEQLTNNQFRWAADAVAYCDREDDERGVGGALGAAGYHGCLLRVSLKRTFQVQKMKSCSDVAVLSSRASR